MIYYYFAYGSNMNKERLENRCSKKFNTPKKVVLPNYKLVFDVLSPSKNYNVANIVPANDNSEVWGLLWELNKNDLTRLDTFEGTRFDLYKRYRITVYNNGTPIKAEAYFGVGEKEITCISKKYMDLIINAAIEYDFPPYYIDYIKSFTG